MENALAAAALCRAANIAPEAVRDGLRSYKPGAHRNQMVLYRDGIQWVNDSKATNPHAANASMSAYPSLIWIVGGFSKGVEYDDLIAQHASRLKAVLIIGTDTAGFKTSLAKYASHVYEIAGRQLEEDLKARSTFVHYEAFHGEASDVEIIEDRKSVV